MNGPEQSALDHAFNMLAANNYVADANRHFTHTREEAQRSLGRVNRNPFVQSLQERTQGTHMTLTTILDASAEVTKRTLKRRDGFTKTTTLNGPSVGSVMGMTIRMPETVHTPIGIGPGETFPPPVTETVRSRSFRLVSASIRVGTPRGTVKELWYEEV